MVQGREGWREGKKEARGKEEEGKGGGGGYLERVEYGKCQGRSCQG